MLSSEEALSGLQRAMRHVVNCAWNGGDEAYTLKKFFSHWNQLASGFFSKLSNRVKYITFCCFLMYIFLKKMSSFKYEKNDMDINRNRVLR